MSDFYYVRTKDGAFRDDLHEFTTKKTKVAVKQMRGNYFDDPKLIVEPVKDGKPTEESET